MTGADEGTLSFMSDKTVIGLSRLIALQQQVDNLARNVANQNTTGFKREGIRFLEYLTDAKEADDIPSAPKRSLVAVTGYTDFSAGSLQLTGNSTDAAVLEDGFFVVRTSRGDRYTRNGAFTLDKQGRLVTLSGDLVLAANGTIKVPLTDLNLSIGTDGTISTARSIIGRLRVVKFDDPRSLVAEGTGLFASGSPPIELNAGSIRLATNALERSNVNSIREMSDLVAATRAYEQVANVVLKDGDPNELKTLAGEDL
ncbi:flagellar basal-body rod protein FlgF [Rhodopseudomonas palustris]|uniref:flagellar basal-body rod protein FlgF n=2 Tax=Rhodopseudomonas TaxID=1073 RepID=UPI001FDA96BB|nr:flagellar basal-body rod protein FlgF [Rhodopseudomonas palustris]